MTYDPEQCRAEREKAESEIMEELKKLNKRLYIDNGDLSIQTRIDRLTVAHLTNERLARAALLAVIAHVVVNTLSSVGVL